MRRDERRHEERFPRDRLPPMGLRLLWTSRVIVIPSTGPVIAPRVSGPLGYDRGETFSAPGRSAAPSGDSPMQRLLAVLSVTLLAATLGARAAGQPPSTPGTTDQQLQKDKQQAAFDQERLRREFTAFQ